MARNHRTNVGRSATPNNVRADRSDKNVYALTRTVIDEVLNEEGVSIRDAARWLRVQPSTVQRQRSTGLMIPWLRSHRLAAPFLRKLLAAVEERNGSGV